MRYDQNGAWYYFPMVAHVQYVVNLSPVNYPGENVSGENLAMVQNET